MSCISSQITKESNDRVSNNTGPYQLSITVVRAKASMRQNEWKMGRQAQDKLAEVGQKKYHLPVPLLLILMAGN